MGGRTKARDCGFLLQSRLGVDIDVTAFNLLSVGHPIITLYVNEQSTTRKSISLETYAG